MISLLIWPFLLPLSFCFHRCMGMPSFISEECHYHYKPSNEIFLLQIKCWPVIGTNCPWQQSPILSGLFLLRSSKASSCILFVKGNVHWNILEHHLYFTLYEKSDYIIGICCYSAVSSLHTRLTTSNVISVESVVMSQLST